MNADTASTAEIASAFSQLRLGRDIIQREATALAELADRIDFRFCDAVQLVHQCRGSVVVIGMGKAGWIGQKIAATFASTGTHGYFIHPAEAVHGDLGRIRTDDLAIMLSNSGETEEVVRLLPWLDANAVKTIAITSQRTSLLAKSATVTLELGKIEEACPLGLAPSTTTTAMLAIGDAIALVASRMKGFRHEDFAKYHPGGSLGLKLSRVEDVMRPLDRCRIAKQADTVRTVLIGGGCTGRRTGAVMLTDDRGRLAGVFTDSDLARLFEAKRDRALDEPIGNVMTMDPTTIVRGAMLNEAVDILAARRISELPVVTDRGHPCGLIDITDVLGLLPHEDQPAPLDPATSPRDGSPKTTVMTIPFRSKD